MQDLQGCCVLEQKAKFKKGKSDEKSILSHALHDYRSLCYLLSQ